LTRIEIDLPLIDKLRKQNLTRHSVPERDRVVFLRGTANLSTGGTARDVTKEVHPEIRGLAERIARWVDLDICGIDLIHANIGRPPTGQTAVIEVNAGPGLRMHLAPSEGAPCDVAGAIAESLFPDGSTGRIPVVAVTGTNGKTTVTRFIAHCLGLGGARVGVTTSDGIWIGNRFVAGGDTTGPRSARTVLGDPAVEAAVLETARGGIVRGGLGFDWSDVGVITNILPDHFGQDGVECIEDLVRIKSLIAERVREGGTIVLNADDAQSARLADRSDLRDRKIVLYSLSTENTFLRAHLARGGSAFVLSGGILIETGSGFEMPLVRAEDLKFALHGTADFQVSNALAACAAARALGLPVEKIRQALTSFHSEQDNLGRTCVYRVGKGHLCLDYGHNADAIRSVARMVRRWSPRRVTAVLGLPGDRCDELLRNSAEEAVLGFDRLILRDDRDLRGRAPGEVPNLMREVAGKLRPEMEVRIELDGDAAIEAALEELQVGDIAVFFYDDLASAVELLRRYDPQPVTEPGELLALRHQLSELERKVNNADRQHASQTLAEIP
jgi:cyanophycin synthetase